MKLDTERATMDLERLQIVRLRGARGVRLSCGKGSLWITQEGVARDDFLVPGVSQVVETDGMVVIEAMTPSSLTVDSEKQTGAIVSARPEPQPA
jgi:hypothetical protein